MSGDFAGKKELCHIRSVAPADLPFLFSTWLKGMYYGNGWKKNYLSDPTNPPREAPIDFFGSIDQRSFFESYHAFLERLIEKPGVCILVCCLKDDPDVILGYSVSEPHVLHWVFVKEPWRRLGIAKDLVPSDTKVFTHFTKIGWLIRPKSWIFNPFHR